MQVEGVSSNRSADLSLFGVELGHVKLLICIKVESMASPIVLTKGKRAFLHIN